MSEMSGPIRFVGGMWHNRTVDLAQWPRELVVQDPLSFTEQLAELNRSRAAEAGQPKME